GRMATTYYSSEVRPNIASQIVMYLLRVLEVLLALRFFLKLFAANPGAGFTSFVYNISQPLVAPFTGVFGITVVNNPPGSIFEWTTLLAMLVYWIIAAILIRLFSLGTGERVARHAYAKEIDDDDFIDDDRI